MPQRETCRIVVTGIGLCTPFGADRESSWRGMLSGVSATRWLETPHWTGGDQMAGASVLLPSHRPFRHSEPLIELALTTATEAFTDAGLDRHDARAQAAGIV